MDTMALEMGIACGKDLAHITAKRGQMFLFEKIYPESRQRYEAAGWEVDRVLQHHLRMRREKPLDQQYEDRVWSMLSKLGFTYLNADRNLHITYREANKTLTQQVDILAADAQVALVVECKTAEGPIPKRKDFKKDIEMLHSQQEGLTRAIRKRLPGRRVAFVFATLNCIVSRQDKSRMREYDIFHLDEDGLVYYEALAKQLGGWAKHQLLGAVLGGRTFSGKPLLLPAVQGILADRRYYMFSMDPEMLLSMSYIPHWLGPEGDAWPRYQRIRKQQHMQQAQEFIKSGGAFPNAVIISLDTQGQPLRFERVACAGSQNTTKLGVLYLPQRYRSAYLVDGQQRLYSYAARRDAGVTTVPVIAFVDLSPEEQARWFLNVHRSQKPISKGLQDALLENLDWDSPDPNQARWALRLRICRKLAVDPDSPLYGRIRLETESGEKTGIRIGALADGMKAGRFFGTYNKAKVTVHPGILETGSNDINEKRCVVFLQQCFFVMKQRAPGEWEDNDAKPPVLLTDQGLHAFLQLLGELLEYLGRKGTVDPRKDSPAALAEAVSDYLAGLADALESLTPFQRLAMQESTNRRKEHYLHTFERVVHQIDGGFAPEGLQPYWAEFYRRRTLEAIGLMRELRIFLQKNFCNRLFKAYGERWFSIALPLDLQKKLLEAAQQETRLWKNTVAPEALMNLQDLWTAALYEKNWEHALGHLCTLPGESNLPGGKKAKAAWLFQLAELNMRMYREGMEEAEFLFIKRLHTWFIQPD